MLWFPLLEHDDFHRSYSTVDLRVRSDTAAPLSLRRLLCSLPQELYDEIFNLVFTATPSVIIIDKSYKPPAQLQVNRSTRQQFERSYYSPLSIFIQDPSRAVSFAEYELVHDTYCKWLASLPRDKRSIQSAVIPTVEQHLAGPWSSSPYEYIEYRATCLLQKMRRRGWTTDARIEKTDSVTYAQTGLVFAMS